MARDKLTDTILRLPEPYAITDIETTKEYLNELVRALEKNSSLLFSDDYALIFESSRIRPFVEVSAAYSAGTTDSVILADSSSGSFAVTLPLAEEMFKTYIDVKKIDSNAATVVSVEGSGDDTPVVLNGSGRPSVTLYCDGQKYWII